MTLTWFGYGFLLHMAGRKGLVFAPGKRGYSLDRNNRDILAE